MLSIGLMSGTSMDGIDAALLETDGSAAIINALGYDFIAYDPRFTILLKATEYAIRTHLGDLTAAAAHFEQLIASYLTLELNLQGSAHIQQLQSLSAYLCGEIQTQQPLTLEQVIQHSTYLHRCAVEQLLATCGYASQEIHVIGYHGQTMFHRPAIGVSVVIGCGQALADQTGITVVNDFRSRDIAAGGQGAPFAPLYHHALALHSKKTPLAVINCGGIANITFIPSAEEEQLLGFDTGPGNGLIDRLVRQRTQGKETMDENGRYGLQGTVHPQVLQALYATAIIKNGQPYFALCPPKSLDIGDMHLIPELDALSLADACATLEAFTADTIVNSLTWCPAATPQQWVLAGGGWKNPVICREFRQRLQQKLGIAISIHTADDIGWNSQAMEAQIFAYLAVRSLQNKPLSLPGTTGVAAPLSGGQVYHARSQHCEVS